MINLLFIILVHFNALSKFYSVEIITKKIPTYQPTWDSLDSRPLPQWFDEDKIGIFMHYGVYSVPSFGSEWFWLSSSDSSSETFKFMKNNYAKSFTYQDFAPMWKAEFFNASKIANIVKESGAKYVTFTTKHHEGFTLWNSNQSWNWNSVDIGPKKNLVKLLVDALRIEGLKVCLYFSLFEWFHPLYLLDKSNYFSTQFYVNSTVIPQLYDLVNTFKPDCIWSDGDWEAMSDYWNSKEFLAWLFNSSPVKNHVVVNDRWGIDSNCQHGSYRNCQDRYNPGTLVNYKWENAISLDKYSWGYRRNTDLEDVYSIGELLEIVFDTISFGGNTLINFGLTSEGTVPLIYAQILKQLGEWLTINGESIYKTKSFRITKEYNKQTIWYTASKYKDYIAYAIFMKWPLDNEIILKSPKVFRYDAKISLLGYTKSLPFKDDDHIKIILPPLSTVNVAPAYVLKLDNFF